MNVNTVMLTMTDRHDLVLLVVRPLAPWQPRAGRYAP
jgi:hypothetical protein